MFSHYGLTETPQLCLRHFSSPTALNVQLLLFLLMLLPLLFDGTKSQLWLWLNLRQEQIPMHGMVLVECAIVCKKELVSLSSVSMVSLCHCIFTILFRRLVMARVIIFIYICVYVHKHTHTTERIGIWQWRQILLSHPIQLVDVQR